MRRSSRRTVAFAAAGLVLAVLVVELLLRGVFAVAPLELHFFKYRTAPWIRDDHPGWGPWHHADAETVHVMRCAEARYTSNSFGMRDRPRQLARTAGTPRVAVLGDSFTEGFLVGDDETFCALLEDRHFSGGVEFLNFGTSGNLGTTQQWLQYEHLARRFGPDVVLVAFLHENDLYENVLWYWEERGDADRRRPYLMRGGEGEGAGTADGDWALRWVGEETTRFGWRQRAGNLLMRWSYLARVLNEVSLTLKYRGAHLGSEVPSLEVYDARLPERMGLAWDTTRESLRRLRDAVAADGGRLALVELAEQAQIDPALRAGIEAAEGHDPAFPGRQLQAIAADLGVGYHSLVPAFVAYRDAHQLPPPYFGRTCDRHWSQLGHRVAAEELARYLRASGLLDELD